MLRAGENRVSNHSALPRERRRQCLYYITLLFVETHALIRQPFNRELLGRFSKPDNYRPDEIITVFMSRSMIPCVKKSKCPDENAAF